MSLAAARPFCLGTCVLYAAHACRTYDPILLDLLQPAIAEGSFAPMAAIAQDMLDKSINATALREQMGLEMDTKDRTMDYPTMRRQALFRTLFTHLNTTPHSTHGVPVSTMDSSTVVHSLRALMVSRPRPSSTYCAYSMSNASPCTSSSPGALLGSKTIFPRTHTGVFVLAEGFARSWWFGLCRTARL